MRPVLFALQPVGTGKVYRSLAIAEQLKILFPALEPTFLAAPSAATLLREATSFAVEDALTPVVAADGVAPGEVGPESERAVRRHFALHAREVVEAARRVDAELVVVDGIWSAPSSLRRAGFDSVLLADDMLDAGTALDLWRRPWSALLRRSAVASSRLRFFVGEPSYLASPELRVWSRRFFRYTGPISGLARYRQGDGTTLRDELGLRQENLVVIAAGGSSFHAVVFEQAVQAAAALAAARKDVRVLAVAGPELQWKTLPDGVTGQPWVPELHRTLAIADLCVAPGGLTLLSECAGLGVPTLCLPLARHGWQERMARYFEGRHGVVCLLRDQQEEKTLLSRMEAMLEPRWQRQSRTRRPVEAPGPYEQRRNADYVADLIAELLGRRRPGA